MRTIVLGWIIPSFYMRIYMTKTDRDTFPISVIVPTYNRSKYLEYTLNSLASQDLPTSDFEVIVVDDGSTDDTFRVVHSFEKIINIKYVYQADRGFRASSARNLGIRIADGKVCLFIDGGMITKSNCLRQHIKAHNCYQYDVVILGYIYGYAAETNEEFKVAIDPNNADFSIANLSVPGAPIQKVHDMRENVFQKYSDKIEETLAPWTLLWSGHFSASKNSLFEVGLFDEGYDGHWSTEDNDLGYRLHCSHKQILLCRDAIALHLPHKLNVRSRLKDVVENCRYFNNKYKTFESQLYFEHYAQDLSGQYITNSVIDFHEVIVKARSQVNRESLVNINNQPAYEYQ
ncbi:MAG: glycosyltransferase [Crocosphaera sp.]